METEKISVIVPVFRTEKYLERCAASICSQTYRNLEIILVDDGSDDGCPEICDALAQKDSRIRVIHKQNGGLSSARNAGLDQASGGYISFIDSDDYVTEDFLQLLKDTMESTGADMVKVDYEEVHTQDASPRRTHLPVQCYSGDNVQSAFLDLKVDSACVFLYKKELIGDSRFPVGKTSEDIPFNFEIFRKADTFAFLPEKRYCYYQNAQSISNGPLDRNMLNYLFFREEILNHYQKQDNPDWIYKSQVLYARAAMGLMARMALYGITPDMDEKQCKADFKARFSPYEGLFFRDSSTPFSRKVLALLVFHFYPIAKILRGILK